MPSWLHATPQPGLPLADTKTAAGAPDETMVTGSSPLVTGVRSVLILLELDDGLGAPRGHNPTQCNGTKQDRTERDPVEVG